MAATKLRALVVDDSRSNRHLEEKILKDLGVETHAAEDGSEALKFMLQQGPFDLIILDLLMPRMNGHELLEEIAKNTDIPSYMKIIILSGTEESEVIQAMKEGAHDYWLKGSSPFMLKHKIKMMLHMIQLEKQVAGLA